jgi:hypothetical protein
VGTHWLHFLREALLACQVVGRCCWGSHGQQKGHGCCSRPQAEAGAPHPASYASSVRHWRVTKTEEKKRSPECHSCPHLEAYGSHPKEIKETISLRKPHDSFLFRVREESWQGRGRGLLLLPSVTNSLRKKGDSSFLFLFLLRQGLPM